MPGVWAVDVGRTRIKAMILGEEVPTRPVVSAPTALSIPAPGVVEVDASALWDQVLAVLREAVQARPEVAAVAADAPAGSRGLLCLPYLAGSGAPDYDSEARGALLGLTLTHGWADVARAILEGTTVELAGILDAAREYVKVERLVASGGGARHRLLLEMLANLAGVPAEVAPHADTTLLGAGLLAWVWLGRWPDTSTAATALLPSQEKVVPEPTLLEVHGDLYRRYGTALAGLRRLGALLQCEESQHA